ncbi:hypothetical protein FHS78_002719 [Parvibaculum indicum]|uniref:hypothetical protein n=1 Tax=Parvibaculum indicum TaxID=562969 RepID=UPI00142333C5|nr:hypothetical protein [Parvibaculum indicum]NIJ42425.1 hypothetical protein [Parvibaculum indicum]
MSANVSLIAEDMRESIGRNFVRSERAARMAPFFFIGFVLTALVALGAVAVDYMIVSEFWTRALANEFLELPGALGQSVAFKSAQVLFATVAAHMLYEQLGPIGKAVFVRIVFVLAILMLLGVGFMLAFMSLPNGIAATGDGGAGSSLSDTLAGLGLATGGTAETARSASEIDKVREWQPLAWLGSLGIVFLVVTGVAALCLHVAMASVRRIFLSRDYRHRKQDMARLAALEEEYDANRHALTEMEGPENRRHLLWTGLMREARAYEQGLDEARREAAKPAAPAPSVPASKTSRGLLGRKKEEALPTAVSDRGKDGQAAFAERIKACEQSRSLARHEKLFDEWWERRSRNAMKAGPSGVTHVREPIGEVLPPPRRVPIGRQGREQD